MEFWLDTIDLDLIAEAASTVKVKGVTTNPSILSKSDLPFFDIIDNLLTSQSGYLAVQVTSQDKQAMINEAEKLASISRRIIIKVPVTKDGLSTMSYLSQLSIPTMATAIYEPNQILLSMLAGATYAAPYIGRIEELGGNHIPSLLEMIEIIKHQKSSLKIIAAAIRNKQQILDCARLGISAVTVSPAIYQDFLLDNVNTMASLDTFQRDWSEKENRTTSVT